jgi:hypothetical protein
MYCLLIELKKSGAKRVLVYVAGSRLRAFSETLNQAGVRKKYAHRKQISEWVMIISINFINLRTINDLKMTTVNKNLKNEQS